jgi:hypothetical protein
MADYTTLRAMQATYLAASKGKVAWEGDRSLGLAEQISILAAHLADQMLPIAPQPPADDEHVAAGCRLFSDPTVMKGAPAEEREDVKP